MSSLGATHSWVAMCYPLLITGSGIIVCILTTLIATDLRPARVVSEIESTLKVQLVVSTLLMTPVSTAGCSCFFRRVSSLRFFPCFGVSSCTGAFAGPAWTLGFRWSAAVHSVVCRGQEGCVGAQGCATCSPSSPRSTPAPTDTLTFCCPLPVCAASLPQRWPTSSPSARCPLSSPACLPRSRSAP